MRARPRRSPRPPACRSARTRGSAACSSTTTARRSPRATTAAPAARTPRPTRWPRPGTRPAARTAVVTLEPCNHTGRTGPCAEALRRGRRTPRGLRPARPEPGRRRGSRDAARRRRRGRAAGCSPTRPGRSTGPGPSPSSTGGRSSPGSSPPPSTAAAPPPTAPAAGSPARAARRDTHRLRALCDAMLVGTSTVAVDDPQLTVRDERRPPLAAPAAARGDGASATSTAGRRVFDDDAETRPPAHPRPARGAGRRSSPATASTSSSRAGRPWPRRSCGPGWSTRSSPTSRRCCSAPGRTAVADLGIATIADALRLDGHRRDRAATRRLRTASANVRLTMTPTKESSLMFTGIVEELGTVAAVEDQGDAIRAHHPRPHRHSSDAGLGDSIAVNGCCLTVAERTDGDTWTADVMQETLDKTSLARRRSRATGSTSSARSPRRSGSAATSSRATSTASAPIVARTPSEHWEVVEIATAARAWPLPRRQGVDHRRRRQPDRRRGGDDSVHRQPDPRDPRPHDARAPQPGDRVNLEVDVIAKHVEKLLAGRTRWHREGRPS